MTTESIQLPLTLRRRSEGVGAARADAWFIPGADPSTWLDEIDRWNVPTDPLRLLLVPQSPAERHAGGVLVIVDQRVEPTALAEPYLCIAQCLYIPASTILHPPVADSELREMLRLEVNMLHPSIGLIGCATGELLRVSDLLIASPPGAVDWGQAVPGVAVDAQIRSVMPRDVPTLQQLIERARDDIGSDDPADLPKLPGESMLGNLASHAMIGGLASLRWLTQGFGLFGGGGWVSGKIASLRKGLEEARSKELSRLMHLLQNNPDEGLRYALPLNAPNSGRGIGRAGSSLTRRNVNFSLGGLFSSAPADPWQLSWEMHQKLMNKYRELANRELSLGRHRRAAYIFAQLLRAYHAAANALRQGRFFREAAVLYRDQLHDKRAAAECLEEGGLLSEAIELYESLRQFVKVGDLHQKLEHREEAQRAYLMAVQELQTAGDTLNAARLLETKLNAADESLELLEGAWPDHSQASVCLQESFWLLGRLARHDESARRIALLRDPPAAAIHALPLAQVLASVASSYPSFEVRDQAADATRVVAGMRLAAAPPSEVAGLVKSVVRVAPEDQLLARDGQRFVDRLNSPRRAERVKSPLAAANPIEAQPKAKTPVLVRTFRLGGDTNWLSAIPAGAMFYAIGVGDDEVVLLRSTWDGTMQRISWSRPTPSEAAYRLLRVEDHSVMVIPVGVGSPRLPMKNFPAHDAFREQVTAGTPHFFGPGVVFDAALDHTGLIWVLHAQESQSHLVLSAYSAAGSLRASEQTPLPSLEDPDATRAWLHVRGRQVCICRGSELWCGQKGNWRSIDLRSSIAHVSASPVHTRLRLSCAFAEGACLVWPGEFEIRRFAQQLIDPICTILPQGLLLAAGRRQAMLYAIDGYELTHQASFEADPAPPIALLTGPDANHFVILSSEGQVRLFRRA